ncbi:hypothetical protein BLNAU_15720 [Blattamonas nauphoetae]|uniref:Uncharacterized protein n=1 Tax=Blattamonas nauphoetae TaxID=2049346 RepID=A0ABQ9WQ08_9EUKA|nr:hypothetical protein BLNAU_24994 [Blattamonas nauphoetae]KAK2941403.1 hypothetical protein BLNAU_23686 [Blattamonas nauphoetae]KAK2942560.1 hypothetical protein BLNAU_22547 [Blattamonas nauphoetae]KAK2944195.1 hypothetical protein BLNAU_20864 [Blattamonas nauphoetae]KAK2949340.1 hypothetical protein BLNAU_15720 [Blattamonas nauphoetae]
MDPSVRLCNVTTRVALFLNFCVAHCGGDHISPNSDTIRWPRGTGGAVMSGGSIDSGRMTQFIKSREGRVLIVMIDYTTRESGETMKNVFSTACIAL